MVLEDVGMKFTLDSNLLTNAHCVYHLGKFVLDILIDFGKRMAEGQLERFKVCRYNVLLNLGH